ncbi:hypothetical protein NQD34_009986 [Periophthalmus magnuspinnatus]|nr:hypothetical protein NQD34_009986 [Periophthalmus magnuspinnatus]
MAPTGSTSSGIDSDAQTNTTAPNCSKLKRPFFGEVKDGAFYFCGVLTVTRNIFRSPRFLLLFCLFVLLYSPKTMDFTCFAFVFDAPSPSSSSFGYNFAY